MRSGKTNFFVRLALVVFAVFCAFTVVRLQIEINTLENTKEEMNRRISEIQARVNDKQSELSKPLDNDYIIRMAKDKFNLRLPEEIVFYNDLIE